MAMRNEDMPAFAKLLAEVMSSFGKSLPDSSMVATWFKLLTPFQPSTIAAAFTAYAVERPDFAPVPNSIVARCRLLDGRPQDDEAWALALSSRDERETVVWTAEMAQAFALCQNVLDAGDEIGARMAFKDAYNRLVAAARAANVPAVWTISQGWDIERRAVAVNKAVVAGLLPAPQARALLPNLVASTEDADTRPEGLKRVLEAMAELESPVAKAERISQARIDAEDERTREIADQVQDYMQGGAQ
jgi:hypothetical protein